MKGEREKEKRKGSTEQGHQQKLDCLFPMIASPLFGPVKSVSPDLHNAFLTVCLPDGVKERFLSSSPKSILSILSLSLSLSRTSVGIVREGNMCKVLLCQPVCSADRVEMYSEVKPCSYQNMLMFHI